MHSYSLFVALQDTSKDLGATTVCPGTHYCADEDLEELCLRHGAFEVSTNGYTGDDGLLRKGDAFLFNQNVWHRGPRNVDPDGLDRTMFIMTFASAKDVAANDLRRQGLGTYYYQRFNMWGSTFSMLKDATRTMIQPWPFLRAMGLVKTRGITWIHQFCQQFANGEEFYNDSELDDLKDKVFSKVPQTLWSSADSWERFIPETLSIWVGFLSAVNALVVVLYFCLSVIVCLLKGEKLTRSLFKSTKRLFLLLGSVTIISGALVKYFDHTEIAQSVTTGEVFRKPFPLVSPEGVHNFGPTTFPERNDVLIATRFDADFLASYNRFLNFHPGNRRWHTLVANAASLPNNVAPHAAEHIVREILDYKEAGLPTRFLLQNPYTGAWSIMSEDEALKVTRRAVADKGNRFVGLLSQHLKNVLAIARFGGDAAMARIAGERFVKRWSAILYGEKDLSTSHGVEKAISNSSLKIDHAFPYIRFDLQVKSQESRRTATREAALVLDDFEKDHIIQSGEKIWVYYGESDWYEGEIVDCFPSDEECIVYIYNSGRKNVVHQDDIREYAQVKEGDRVEVDYEDEFFTGTVTRVGPDGKCTVLLDGDDVGEIVVRENIVLL